MRDRTVRYRLDEQQRFVVDDYNWATPFSDFFPGVAGLWGIPLWIYTVSRGQAVSSVGVGDKDHQILEFLSFNRACQTVPHEGFRTFLRIDGGPPIEPFVRSDRADVRQKLILSAGELELAEHDERSGLEIEVVYFPLVNLPVAALARQVTIRNIGEAAKRIECLDGLPRVLPYGMNQQHIKFTTRHIEAMMGVSFSGGVPLFRLKQSAADSEHIERLSGGNFYFTVQDDALCADRFIVDPQVVFEDPFQHLTPWGFCAHELTSLLKRRQLLDNTTPCGFTGFADSLAPGASLQWTSVLGNAHTDELLAELVAIAQRPGALAAKRRENRAVLASITDRAFTVSSAKRFDQYAGQTFLDNVMRGGMPLTFGAPDDKRVFYVYCRQNGDLERDYHYFVLEPTYLSQGTGHYRSIYQNRRTDVWFFPEIGDTNIRWFMNLLQLDGYNPLEVRGLTYSVREPEAVDALLRGATSDAAVLAELASIVGRPFTPGELIMALERGGRRPPGEYMALLGSLLRLCDERELGGLHEGFWVDHWFYNLDAIDVYLMVYPDRLRSLLVEDRAYTFFDDPDIILPRADKCVLRNDGQVRRYGAVVRDADKLARLEARATERYRVRTRNGDGEVYRTCLLVKLLCVVANRLATLDAQGVGVEMEADKPGWNDSMNGLPALFGSSLCETLELLKACRFLSDTLTRLGDVCVAVYEELGDLMDELDRAFAARAGQRDDASMLAFWDASNTAKESYRARTQLGVSGVERMLDGARIRAFVDAGLALLDPLLDDEHRGRVKNPDGVPYTYFVNKVVEHEPTGRRSHQGLPLVAPKRFHQEPVPLFLEGPVHYMKAHPDQARQVYEAVRKSELFDRKLSMYKSCVDMSQQSYELGRAVGAYPRGWLENESIYLHMEYKYLLEVLRAGLFDAFYDDLRSVVVSFHDPAVYGRSTLEGASFIVSSAYADASLHGRGFQPRLSGITCEMLHVWVLMVAGPQPMFVDDAGELRLGFAPALAGWMFTEQAERQTVQDPVEGPVEVSIPTNAFAFRFLGSTLVVYENSARVDTWGEDGVRPTRHVVTWRDGAREEVAGSTLGSKVAIGVREGRVARVDVTLGR